MADNAFRGYLFLKEMFVLTRKTESSWWWGRGVVRRKPACFDERAMDLGVQAELSHGNSTGPSLLGILGKLLHFPKPSFAYL